MGAKEGTFCMVRTAPGRSEVIEIFSFFLETLLSSVYAILILVLIPPGRSAGGCASRSMYRDLQ